MTLKQFQSTLPILSLWAFFSIIPMQSPLSASTWNNPGTGCWNTAANWCGGVPCGVGCIAIFQCAGANQTVTYQNFTVFTYGGITINDNNSFDIGQNNSDWIDWNNTGTNNIPITVNASGFTSAHTITADLFFYDCIDYSINSGSLEHTGNFNDIGGNYGWNKTGAGRLIIDVTGGNYVGANTITNGTVEIESTISLGDAAGVTNTTVSNGATLAIDIAGGGTINDETFTISGTGDGGAGAIDLMASSGNITIAQGITLAGNASIDVSSAADTLTLNGAVSGANALTKTGAGTLNLNASNTYTGNTVVSGGTLLLGGNERISNTSGLNLAGGEFDTGGNNETMGSLTLSANSVIDMGGGSSTLAFSSFSYSGGEVDIWNWSGTAATAGGTDQILFTSTFSTNLDKFNFYSDNGTTLISSSGMFIGSELVPTPEPSTYLATATLILIALLHFKTRLKSHRSEKNTRK